MEKLELNNFYNEGFGWICRRCERELQTEETDRKTSRLMTEGESESKQPKLSNIAMAKWTNEAQQSLICPRCGITESTNQHG
jgi:hypothetical protein